MLHLQYFPLHVRKLRQLIALTASMHNAPAHVWFKHASISAYQGNFVLLTQQGRAQGMY